MRADVIVVGLGAMGAAAAWQLARRGLRVVGLDRFHPPHGHGAHGGSSRIIRMAYMEGAGYVPLVARSYQLWRELEATSGQPLLTVTGGLMLGRPDSTAVAGALLAARTHGLAYELLGPALLRRRFPVFALAPDDVGLYEPVAGLLRPEPCVAAMLEQARRAGAQLRPGVAVRDWNAGADDVRVRTDSETLVADRLVLAPGAWAADLARLEIQLRVQRRVQHYFAPRPLRRYRPGRLPIWIWDDGEVLAYGLPAVDGTVKAAFHTGDDPADPRAGAAPARPEEAQVLRLWLAARLPGLATARLAGSQPCLYTLTPDEHFVIGVHPHAPRVAVACGFPVTASSSRRWSVRSWPT